MQNATVVTTTNATKTMTTNATKIMTTNATKVTTRMNATTITVLNVTKSSIPVSVGTEKLGINSSLTTQINVNKTNTGNTTGSSMVHPSSDNSTSGQSKKISLSEHVGIIIKQN